LKLVGRVPRAELDGGQLVRLEYPPFDVVVALVEGQPFAIEDACNHAGASLAAGDRSTMRPNCVVCPLHGYVFDLRTGAIIVQQGLCDDQRAYECTIEGDEVLVWDPTSIEIKV